MRNKNLVFKLLTQITFLMFTVGCSSIGGVANTALEAAGIKKPELPELPDIQKPARKIPINLHAGENLNVDENGRPLALIARIYKLKQNTAFQQSGYDTFLNPQKEKEVLGADLLEVKEVTLIPGQHYQVEEKVSGETYFIGIVALFRSPASQRWRATFATSEVEKTGITVGLHACALSIGIGKTSDATMQKTAALSSVRCT
ncbi:MAG: type VI secretion system lipoprotein TssJ [Pseudomonadota bacterium]